MTDENLFRNLAVYSDERTLKRQQIKDENVRDVYTIDLSKELSLIHI